jgi:hypothetical protein
MNVLGFDLVEYTHKTNKKINVCVGEREALRREEEYLNIRIGGVEDINKLLATEMYFLERWAGICSTVKVKNIKRRQIVKVNNKLDITGKRKVELSL